MIQNIRTNEKGLKMGIQIIEMVETSEFQMRVSFRTAGRALERHARRRHEAGRGKRLVQHGVLFGAATAACARLDACGRRRQQHKTGGGRRRQQRAEPREQCAQRFARVKGALQRAAVGARDAEQRLCVCAHVKWQEPREGNKKSQKYIR